MVTRDQLRNHETIRRPELSMDVAMTEPHLGAEQRRALQMLASAGQNRATEAFMLAHGARAASSAGGKNSSVR